MHCHETSVMNKLYAIPRVPRARTVLNGLRHTFDNIDLGYRKVKTTAVYDSH